MVPGRPLLQLTNICKSYRGPSSTLSVLENVNLEIEAGQKVSLIGASGSGKSTLLSLVAGLLRPDSGSIDVDGVAIESLDDSARAARRAEQIGVVLQSENLVPFLTAVENVELAMAFANEDRPRNRARQLLDQFGVDHRRDHLPRHLSGGEAQRVAIAVALANEPALLLADEVVGALDSSTADKVVDIIFESDLAVLFVTHNIELAQRAEQCLRLADKKVVPA